MKGRWVLLVMLALLVGISIGTYGLAQPKRVSSEAMPEDAVSSSRGLAGSREPQWMPTSSQESQVPEQPAAPASRARSRVQSAAPPAATVAPQPEVVRVRWEDFLKGDLDAILANFPSSPTSRQRDAARQALETHLQLYVSSFATLVEQTRRAAHETLDRNDSQIQVPGDRFRVVGVSRGGNHTDVRVFKSRFPQVFALADEIDGFPDRLRAAIETILQDDR